MSGIPSKASPDLIGRRARCICGQTTSSSWELRNFEYRGPGSRWALDICVCGYHRVAHHDEIRTGAVSPTLRNCPGFHPRGESAYDGYWCGCEQGDERLLQLEEV